MSSIQQRKKQILFWNAVSLQNIANISAMFQRQALNEKHTKHDFAIRDFYFSKTLPSISQFSPSQTFIDKAVEHLKSFINSNRTSFVEAHMYEMTVKKHQFWNRIRNLYPKNKEQAQSKQAVNTVLWKQRLVPLTIFGVFGLVFMHLTGILKLNKRKWFIGAAAMAYSADMITKYRKSSQIFYSIPKLADKQLEKQKRQIINETVVMDGRVNQIKPLNAFSFELITKASKEQQKAAQRDMINAAGFSVVEQYDEDKQEKIQTVIALVAYNLFFNFLNLCYYGDSVEFM